MGFAVEWLARLVKDSGRYDIPYSDLRDMQIQAMNERFQERKDRIRLLAHRAKEGDIAEIRSLDDAVPLLFPHTAYKSYPEGWLAEGKWDRMTKWLGTVSPHPIKDIDLTDVADIDDWIARLEKAGHYLSCSSGTTGKNAMLPGSQMDMDWCKVDSVQEFSWATGIAPAQDRQIMGCAAVATAARMVAMGDAQKAAFARPDWGRIDYPVPPITVGALTRMVTLRRSIADGTAKPESIAQFEKTSQERQKMLESAVGITADRIIENREKKLIIAGMWAAIYQVAKAVRDKGYGTKDFNPDNCLFVAGGLKGAVLPLDYQEFVHETFNFPANRRFQTYSMQEINTGMPKCPAGRYHVPPWLVPLVLNKDGDTLLPQAAGEYEGRAAFFDIVLDGRWGGVISGDKISIDFGPCKCGAKGPSIRDNIARYKDLEGDDKIACSGTVDAYVRGVA